MSGAHALEPTDGPLTFEELQLAARNRGIPLEALAYDVTPSGLHYLLVHFDIPDIDPATWRLRVGGHVERPLELSLDEIRARPRRTAIVTLECAGNGRARLDPRPISQPWLVEAVSTAEWAGPGVVRRRPDPARRGHRRRAGGRGAPRSAGRPVRLAVMVVRVAGAARGARAGLPRH